MSLQQIRAQLDQPSEAEVASMRKRRAVVRYDDEEQFWYVVYYTVGRRRFVIDWASWEMALLQALRWVGLAR